MGIQLFSAAELETSFWLISDVAKRLPQVAMKDGSVWLKSGRGLEIESPQLVFPLTDETQTAAKPCVAQRAVDLHSPLKASSRVSDLVFCAQKKSLEGVGRRI